MCHGCEVDVGVSSFIIASLQHFNVTVLSLRKGGSRLEEIVGKRARKGLMVILS